jgi:hypothetical protein
VPKADSRETTNHRRSPTDGATSRYRISVPLLCSAPDLVALVTSSFFNATQGHQTKSGPAVVRSFPLPVRTEAITVSQMWHPRLDGVTGISTEN